MPHATINPFRMRLRLLKRKQVVDQCTDVGFHMRGKVSGNRHIQRPDSN